MTTGVLAPTPILQFFGNNGAPLVGGSVLTQVGSTNTATYQDSGLTTPLANPIPLNSRGEVSTSSGASCQCFLTPNTVYTFTLYDASGNQVNQALYVNGVQLSASTIGAIVNSAFAFNQASTGNVFANAGAEIQRFNDRVFVGAATVNDGDYPNVTQDWLTAFQVSYNTATGINGGGPVNGSITGVQAAVLGFNSANNSIGAMLFGGETANIGSMAGSTEINVVNAFGINNNTNSLATTMWTYYAEAHRINDTVSTTVGFELGVVQRGSYAQSNPYYLNVTKEAVGFISECGAGFQVVVTMSQASPGVVNWTNHGLAVNTPVVFSQFSGQWGSNGTLPIALTPGTVYYVQNVVNANSFNVSATVSGGAINFAGPSSGQILGASQFPATVAYYISANPVPWDKGIVFTADSIYGATGGAGTGYALNFASGQLVQWWAPGGSNTGVPTGYIFGDGTLQANQTGIVLGDATMNIQMFSTPLIHTQFVGVASAVNYFKLYHAATGNPVAIEAAGTDTNIDVEILPQGTAYLKYGSYVNTPATSAGYIYIKDSGGTLRKLMVGT